MVLEVIDKLDEEDGNPRLHNESQEKRRAVGVQSDQENSFDKQGTNGLRLAGPQGTQHLQRNGSQNMRIDAATPWRRSWVDRTSPMLVVRVVVFNGEMKVKNRQQIKAGEPPT